MAARRKVYLEGADRILAEELDALPNMPLDALKRRWRDIYGSPPPSRLGRALMTRAIAYRMQEQTFGGLSQVIRRQLARAAEEISAGRTPSSPPAKIKPGTRLLRDWQGVTHEVIVMEDGVRYRGKTWASLSAVAREITGTRWSGPLFFGLKGRPR
tara:strand:- start:1875 stop:2342 length:468 start_codon:yes stop_codon:yes gene_type:complete